MKYWLIFSLLVILCHSGNAQTNILFEEINLDRVRSEYGLTGKGAAVAVLDRGIDYRHPDFINPDGTTRILAIWDLSDDTGALFQNNPYGKGTIYNESDINNALMTGVELATQDYQGHGVVTAGIAVGNGSASSTGIEGVAPDAKIIVIKITSEGTPEFNGNPATQPFSEINGYLEQSIEFIKNVAEEADLPVSMIANFGSIQGPMDGTSTLSRMIDSEFGEDDHGVAFICGSGDEGGVDNHAGGQFIQSQTVDLKINKTSNVRFDMWYSKDDDIEIEIITPSASYGPFQPPTGPNDRNTEITNDFTYYHNGSDVDFFGAENNKREVLIDFGGLNGEITIRITGLQIENGRFDAILNLSWIFMQNPNEFLTFVEEGHTIWDLASSHNNINPNSYIHNNSWTAAEGGVYSYPGHENGVGSLWTGSGIGPTFDDRIGIDISVPGNINVGAYGPDSYFAYLSANVVEAGEFPYGVLAAVSGANPVLAGVVALMLEADPTLTALDIKRILKKTARQDNFTGVTPNFKWGAGKLDAFAAITEVLNPTTTFELEYEYVGFSIRPNPTSGLLSLDLSNYLGENIAITLNTFDGKVLIVERMEITAQVLDLDISGLEKGFYFLNVVGEKSRATQKIIKL